MFAPLESCARAADYSAPEAIFAKEGYQYTHSADVYSFGVLACCLLELTDPEIEYITKKGYADKQAALLAIKSGTEVMDLELLKKKAPLLAKSIAKCWESNPIKRPGMPTVVKTFEEGVREVHDRRQRRIFNQMHVPAAPEQDWPTQERTQECHVQLRLVIERRKELIAKVAELQFEGVTTDAQCATFVEEGLVLATSQVLLPVPKGCKNDAASQGALYECLVKTLHDHKENKEHNYPMFAEWLNVYIYHFHWDESGRDPTARRLSKELRRFIEKVVVPKAKAQIYNFTSPKLKVYTINDPASSLHEQRGLQVRDSETDGIKHTECCGLFAGELVTEKEFNEAYDTMAHAAFALKHRFVRTRTL